MIRIAICDDEQHLRDDLADLLSHYLHKKQVGFHLSTFADGESLLSADQSFEIILLDIKMTGMSGMETARALRKRQIASHIIFITALKEYVFESFDVDAINFLVKPVVQQKLIDTLDKILLRIATRPSQFMILRQGGCCKKIKYAEIMYCESVGHSITLYLQHSSETFLGNFETLEENLNRDFFQCHRSYIVNFRYIQRCEDGLIFLTDGEKLPLAKRRKQEFLSRLLRYHRNEVR